ncbi:gag-asp_proteas domain-containing protein [Cucumis melo var. makuwa]|uniref:Gag-asp_proteas domain-containing protein n=1 Tax=Cucumis melo var. makuwa TaxID=1194695 RepID=A0A5D3DZI9_CUCMM|nr:gag-asp_proteas domain-containing protein [Cucumis melo var. makuwa]TYK28878.1 gag-asp_proteas domain-containing protein [Cucumis melo var. makuwa]
MGALKFLSPIQKKASHQKDAFEKGLMFVDAVIKSKTANSTMVDSVATYNFISEQEAHQLELKIEGTGKLKAVNFEALPIVGVSKRVSLKLGKWKVDVDLDVDVWMTLS